MNKFTLFPLAQLLEHACDARPFVFKTDRATPGWISDFQNTSSMQLFFLFGKRASLIDGVEPEEAFLTITLIDFLHQTTDACQTGLSSSASLKARHNVPRPLSSVVHLASNGQQLTKAKLIQTIPATSGVDKPQATLALAWGVGTNRRLNCSCSSVL
jgi:hypothetical protein